MTSLLFSAEKNFSNNTECAVSYWLPSPINTLAPVFPPDDFCLLFQQWAVDAKKHLFRNVKLLLGVRINQ